MGKVCELCGKRGYAGNRVSHSNRKTRRLWKPNIQKLLTEIDGSRKRLNICTRCLRSGKVKRPSAVKPPVEAASEARQSDPLAVAATATEGSPRPG